MHIFNKNELPKDSTYVIQEYITGYKKIAENWRITTLISKKTNKPCVHSILLTINKNSNDIKTNCNTFYHNYEIKSRRMRFIKSAKWVSHNYDEKLINKAIEIALELHESLNKGIKCIGWDVILSENGPCFLEGNVVPGVLRRNDIYYYEKINKYIEEIE